MVDPLSYFLFYPGPRDVITKAVVCAVLCWMVHIRDPLLLSKKSSPYSGIKK